MTDNVTFTVTQQSMRHVSFSAACGIGDNYKLRPSLGLRVVIARQRSRRMRYRVSAWSSMGEWVTDE